MNRSALPLVLGVSGRVACACCGGLAGAAKGAADIGRAVVGHHPLDGDAQAGEPGDGALEEGDGTFLALVGQDLGVGKAGGIVDADMQEVPADAAAALGPVAGDAVADAVDPAELLDVEVDQLAGPCPLVAEDLRLGVERLEPTEAVAAQDQAHGGDRAAEPAGDGGAGQAWRRSARISAGAASPRRVGLWCGRDERSARPASPSRAWRAGHLRTVLGVTPAAAATRATLKP